MSHLPTLGGPCGPPIPFPTAASSHLRIAGFRPRPIAHGTISQHISILYNGPEVEVLCPRSGSRLAAWSFAIDDERRSGVKSSRDENDVFGTAATEVTCVAFLEHKIRPGLTNARRFVVVGTSNGIVGVIDIKSSQLIRVVKFQHRVTSVAIVKNGSKTSSDPGASTSRFFPDELQAFEGIIAVGTQEGRLYLLDAAVDLPDSDENEKNPALPHFFPKRSKFTDLAKLRPSIHQRGERLCLELNVESFIGTKKIFEYFSVITRETTYFPLENVIVSSLMHVPQLGGLLVGFNFGSWQLFNLSTLKLEFASAYEGSETANFTLPVTGFAFSEPENDPRNFCYVWVVRSEADFDSVEEKTSNLKSKATVSLYALAFQNRDEFYGNVYSGLTSCSLRFDHTLVGDPQTNTENQTVGSICLSAVTIGSSDSTVITADEAETSDDAEQDLLLNKKAITMFLWEVQLSSNDSSSKSSKCYLGMFDLNAWYQAQMPILVELERGSQCSFFSFCSLDELKSSVEDDAAQIIDVFVDVSTLSRFNNASTITTTSTSVTSIAAKPEQFFYPSSFMFEFFVAFDNCFVHANHLGLQRKVLLELQSQGKSGLVDPDELYQLCLIAGLIVNPGTALQQDSGSDELSEEAAEERISSDEKRSHLFNVALQNNLFNLLTGCLSYWSDGKFIEAGCTIKFVVDWAWTSVANIKQSVDKTSVSLFDCSGHDLTEEERKSMLQLSQQLNLLNTLLKKAHEIVADTHRWQNFDFDELGLKIDLSSLIKIYVEAILWFVNAGLLPEPSEDSGFSVFPAQHLSKLYAEKRARMKQQLQQWRRNGWIDSEAEPSLLLIDDICDLFGRQFKTNMEREGGVGLYPPPTFHAVLLTYLIHRIEKADDRQPDICTDLILKHRFVQYLFLDLASCLTSNGANLSNHSIIDTLVKFPSAFGVPPSLIKLTQAFWLVDHEDFDDAMSMLLDPLVSSNDISTGQHRSILTAFLIQDQPKLALKYLQMRQPPQKDLTDTQIHISVLLANDKIHESFQHLRRRRSDELNDAKLLRFFFNRCDAAGKLSGILQLPLTTSEERQLIEFLSTSPQMHRQETLLIYLLQRSRYSEAIALNQRLERVGGGGGKTRQAIMNRFSHLVPKFGHDDVTLASKWPGMSTQFTHHPVTAVMASKSSPKPMFQSSLALKLIGEPRQFTSNEFTPFRPRAKRRRAGEEEDNEEAVQAPRSPSPKPTPKQSSILSILTTPQIDRCQTSFLRHSNVASMDHRSTTPQSILKVKMAQRFRAASPTSTSFASQRPNDTAEDDDDDNWLMRHRRTSTASRESTPGKSLRFSVPKKLPPADILTPEQTIYEQSPEISPEKTSVSVAEPEKSKMEVEVETGSEEVFEDDDDSIVLVYSDEEEEVDDGRRSEAEQEASETEMGKEAEPELENESEQEVEYLEHDVVDLQSDEDKSAGDADDDQSLQVLAPEMTFNLHHQTTFADVDFARELASQDSESNLTEMTSVTQPSMAVNVTQGQKDFDVTIYGTDATFALNVDLPAGLASRDSLTQESTETVGPTKPMVDMSLIGDINVNIRGSDVTIYGHQETMLVDDSLVQNLVENDAVESDDPVVVSLDVDVKTSAHPSAAGRRQMSSPTSLADATIMYGPGDATIPVDVSLVRFLAEADDAMQVDETNAKPDIDVSEGLMISSAFESEMSLPLFSFAEPNVISTKPETTSITSVKSATEFKFEEPLTISTEIPRLVFDDTADQSCLDVSKISSQPEVTPARAAEATPKFADSVKKRKPRFSESIASISETSEASARPTRIMKEERFRVKGRMRSTSDTLPSPSVSGRRKSSQSTSDASFVTEMKGKSLSTKFDKIVENVVQEEAQVKPFAAEESLTVTVHDEVEAHIFISADESMMKAELVDLGQAPKVAKDEMQAEETLLVVRDQSPPIPVEKSETSSEVQQSIMVDQQAVDPSSVNVDENDEPEVITLATVEPDQDISMTPSVEQEDGEAKSKVEAEVKTPRVTRRSTTSSSMESPSAATDTVTIERNKIKESEAEAPKSATPSRRSRKSGETFAQEEGDKPADAILPKTKTPEKKSSTAGTPKSELRQITLRSSPMANSPAPVGASELVETDQDQTNIEPEDQPATKESSSVVPEDHLMEITEASNSVYITPRVTRRSSSMLESPPKTPMIVSVSRRQKKTSSTDRKPESLASTPSRTAKSVGVAEVKEAETVSGQDQATPELGKKAAETDQKIGIVTPRVTRRSTLESPPLTGRTSRGQKKTSTTDDSGPEVHRSATPARESAETLPAVVGVKIESSRRTRSSSSSQPHPFLIEGVKPLRAAFSSPERKPEPRKASTPSRRLRVSISVAPDEQVEEVVAVKSSPVVIEKSKRKRSPGPVAGSSPSPPRKSSRHESAQEGGEKPADAISPKSKTPEKKSSTAGTPKSDLRRSKTPEKKSSTTGTPKSELRRSIRKSSSTATSPAPVETSTRKRTRSTSSDAGDLSPATPSIRTPRRPNTTAMSMIKLSPIPENSLKSDAGNVQEVSLSSTTPATSLRTRRTSSKAGTPQKSEPAVKRTRSSDSKVAAASKASDVEEAEPVADPVRKTRSTPTRIQNRRTLVIRDPFSPIPVELMVDEEPVQETKPKKKYITRKTAKSHKI